MEERTKTLEIKAKHYTFLKNSSSGTLEEIIITKHQVSEDDIQYLIKQLFSGKLIIGDVKDYEYLTINIL